MATPQTEPLAEFLDRQTKADLVAMLLELAEAHAPVQARLAHRQLADQPDKLATALRKTRAGWKRSHRFYRYGEAAEFAQRLVAWLSDVERDLLPKDPAAALSLFQTFIEADQSWFERADDSDGLIRDAIRLACRLWLQAATRCAPPRGGWPDRLVALYHDDRFGAREALLRHANLLLDEGGQRGLVERFDAQLAALVDARLSDEHLPIEVFRLSGALSLLAESLRDPDVMVRATLRYSPDPNSLQRESFARAYLDAGKPGDALPWLEDGRDRHDPSREALLAEALEQLGRYEESLPIRQRRFEHTLSELDLDHWLEHLPEASRPAALMHARERALIHEDPAAVAAMLIRLGEPHAAEARLIDAADRINGNHYGQLIALAEAMRTHACLRGETVIYRALLQGILERAYARAYGHAARYWIRLVDLAGEALDLTPLRAHDEFETEIRARHGRKTAFWAQVNATRDDKRGTKA